MCSLELALRDAIQHPRYYKELDDPDFQRFDRNLQNQAKLAGIFLSLKIRRVGAVHIPGPPPHNGEWLEMTYHLPDLQRRCLANKTKRLLFSSR